LLYEANGSGTQGFLTVPHFTLNIDPAGPVLNAGVSVSEGRRSALLAQGLSGAANASDPRLWSIQERALRRLTRSASGSGTHSDRYDGHCDTQHWRRCAYNRTYDIDFLIGATQDEIRYRYQFACRSFGTLP